MSTADDLLRECLHHLKLHNEEYSHRTPADLIERIEGHLRRPKYHHITIENTDAQADPTRVPPRDD